MRVACETVPEDSKVLAGRYPYTSRKFGKLSKLAKRAYFILYIVTNEPPHHKLRTTSARIAMRYER